MKLGLERCVGAMLGVFVLAGCGNADAENDPFRDVVGTQGNLHFQVDAEKPVSQGTNDLMITIYETSTHQAFVGAQVELAATMPAMAHDSPTAATIEEREGGMYIARGLSLPMAGRWVVDVKASREGTSDTGQVTYDLH